MDQTGEGENLGTENGAGKRSGCANDDKSHYYSETDASAILPGLRLRLYHHPFDSDYHRSLSRCNHDAAGLTAAEDEYGALTGAREIGERKRGDAG
jgi:hypothetical protein